jgi:hypothetical protein
MGVALRIVAKHKERPAKGATVEAWLQAIFDILRTPANQQCSRRFDHVVHGLAWPSIDAKHPSHVIIRSRDEGSTHAWPADGLLTSARSLGSSQASWRPSAVMSR